MIFGSSHEKPQLGPGGDVVALGSPLEVANALRRLLTEPDYYENCCKAIEERVIRFYNKADQCEAYAALYQKLIYAETHVPAGKTLQRKKAA
jgi:glycosyltransferase involved in cell wall biosynthesis